MTIVIRDVLQDVTGVNVTTGQLSAVNHSQTQSLGTFTLNGATPVTVADTYVTANSVIIITVKTPTGIGAQPVPQTVTPSTGFTVAGTAGDTSIYNYRIQG